jgi:hypothetical protein
MVYGTPLASYHARLCVKNSTRRSTLRIERPNTWRSDLCVRSENIVNARCGGLRPRSTEPSEPRNGTCASWSK